MKTTIKRKGEKLCCYASGSGALSFTWAKDEYPYPASGKPVTMSHAIAYLNLKNNKGKHDDFSLVDLYGHISLVPKVRRIDSNTLEYKGEEYTYKAEFREDGSLVRPATVFLFDVGDGANTEVKHISTRQALCFFLDKEKFYNELYNPKKDINN